MVISRAKISIVLLGSMAAFVVNGELVIPSSFMTIDPYAEAQHHHESLAPGYYKPQVLPQVSHDPPLSYNVVPGTHQDFLHQSHQQSHHQPHYQEPHRKNYHQPHYQDPHHKPDHQPYYQEPHHKPHYQEPHHQTLYNHDLKPHYQPHHLELPLTPHVAHDKLFLSHNVHTQHSNYKPTKIYKPIKKTPLDFPKKGYVSQKLTPARDDYARALYFPLSGYNIDDYFYDFPAFGYFNYEPKLHAENHHRRRRMLNFKDIEDLETQHATHVLPITKGHLKDSSTTLQRIARSSKTGISTSQILKNVEEKPSVISLLSRVPRTSSIFPKAPELPRLLKPRSVHDKKNTWLNP